MADTVSSTRNRKPSRKRAANDVAIADRSLKKKKLSKSSRHAAASAAEVVTIEESDDEDDEHDETDEHDEDDENGEGEDSEDDEYPPLPNPDENWNDHSWNRDVVRSCSPGSISLIHFR